MRLAYASNGFTGMALSEAIRAIAKIGYQGVEVLADDPHLFPPLVTPIDMQEIRGALEETGLQVSNVNANTAHGHFYRQGRKRIYKKEHFEPSLCSDVPADRRARVDYVRRAADLAAELGAPSVSITSGAVPEGRERKESLATFLKSLESCLSHTRSAGVKLAVEYEPGLLIGTCEDTREMVKKMKRASGLGVNLDLGHAIVAGEDPVESYKALSRRVTGMHIEDIKGTTHKHLVPGEGDVDFEELVGGLRDAGWNGWLTVELYEHADDPEPAARQAHAVLAPLVGGD